VLACWLFNSIDRSFCVEALQEALVPVAAPEIFNTDQGSSQRFLPRHADGCRGAHLDGRPGPLDGQRFHRAAAGARYDSQGLLGPW
jgi:hypothetical protein